MIPLPDLVTLPGTQAPRRLLGPAALLLALGAGAATVLVDDAPRSASSAAVEPADGPSGARGTSAAVGARGPRLPGLGAVLAASASALPPDRAGVGAATSRSTGLVRLRTSPGTDGVLRVAVTSVTSGGAPVALLRLADLSDAVGARATVVDDLQVDAGTTVLTATLDVEVAERPPMRRRPRPATASLAEVTPVLVASAPTAAVGDLRLERRGEDAVVLSGRAADLSAAADWLAGVEALLAPRVAVEELDVEVLDDGVRLRATFLVRTAPAVVA